MSGAATPLLHTEVCAPAAQSRSAVDELLAGLGEDDFDDYQEDPSEKEEVPLRPPTADFDAAASQSDDPYYLPPSPPPVDIPAVVSFATGRGRTLAPPSEKAMSRALKIVREVEQDVETSELPPKRRRLESPVLEALGSAPVPSRTTTPEARCQSEGMQMSPVLSRSSMDRELSTLETVVPPADSPPSARTPPTTSSVMRTAVAPVQGMFTTSSGFQLGTGGSAPTSSPSARARVLALFGESAPSEEGSSASPSTFKVLTKGPLVDTAATETLVPQVPPATPASQLPSAPRPIRLSNLGGSIRPSTPTRAPLRTTTNTYSSGSLVTPKPGKPGKQTKLFTPGSTPRRIGLGAVPGARKAKTGFSTPFKTGVTSSPAKVYSSSTVGTPSTATRPKQTWEAVFDLAAPSIERKSMRASFLYPQFYSPGDLTEMGLPDEIWKINYDNAILYQFIGEDASVLGSEQAADRLKQEGCQFFTQRWVDNHWSFILWKLAGQVLAKPTLFDEKWNWYEVLCQLKYRYEREYGSAQRPIVRRIQEHDSSASLPMVLCVCGIHQSRALDEKDEPVTQRQYLDLTDGWYRIRAAVDDCLDRAIRKGKIRVGRKLSITGAKLESGADGSDVFAAFNTSHLVISGNSTHLARWDARLGVQSSPFIAGLSSLSVDGGVVALMDVVLERVYPLAFMKADRAARDAPWGEDEEACLANEWQVKYDEESNQLSESMRKSLERLEDLTSTLASYAQDVGPICESSSDFNDDEFDDLLEADPKAVTRRLSTYSAAHVVHLAALGRQRLQQAAEAERAGFDARMKEICPPREVRDFRMVRIRDAREGRKEPTRTAMLNVWDARALGSELVEGQRFLVSNIVPGRAGDWSAQTPGVMKEIYLHTRRDTRWRSITERV